MTKREVVKTVLEGKRPPYVPWTFGFTKEARHKIETHLGSPDLEPFLHNHYVALGDPIGFFDDMGNDRVRDSFGVVWDRSVDKDIGVVDGTVLPEPTLDGYTFPAPLDPRFFDDIPNRLERLDDRFRVYHLGFSLYERAWTLRGIANLLTDFLLNPRFVRDLLDSIAEYNIVQIEKALEYDIDAVEFGDDWGQQHGLQMGPAIWREFIKPVMKRMFKVVHDAGKYVLVHSCGDVDELFDDLVEIGLNAFNPFQPEVMDVQAMMNLYRRRMSFYGGLSTQRTLPFGSVDDVREETARLLEMGRAGGYIFAPAHDIKNDVSLENMLAMIETVQAQPGWLGLTRCRGLTG
jgi:uroporphyrinogen decarboxylase